MATVTLELPAEFLELCEVDGVLPETVLRGFIGDLCEIRNYSNAPREDGYASNGSDERRLAREYYDRGGIRTCEVCPLSGDGGEVPKNPGHVPGFFVARASWIAGSGEMDGDTR